MYDLQTIMFIEQTNSNIKQRKEGPNMALTAQAQDVVQKMSKAAPYMTEKTLEFLRGAAEVILLQHNVDPDEPAPEDSTEKKPA